MSDWCCATWKELGKELAEAKTVELNKLMKKGIPRSVFSPIFQILDGICNACPFCGCRLGDVAIAKPIPAEPPVLSKTPHTIPCSPCRGTGKVGDNLNCMTCLGTGKLDKSNPMRRKLDPAFAAELADKEVATTIKVAEENAKLDANPKPLRDDARPENWDKI